MNDTRTPVDGGEPHCVVSLSPAARADLNRCRGLIALTQWLKQYVNEEELAVSAAIFRAYMIGKDNANR